MEKWRKVFRDGFAPLLPTAGLESLAAALRNDDARLIQGCTTDPPPLVSTKGWPCEGGCFLGIVAMGAGAVTVEEVETFFAKACYDADHRLGTMAECRHFLSWFDDTPRSEMRRELAFEVERELAGRQPLEQKSPAGPALAGA